MSAIILQKSKDISFITEIDLEYLEQFKKPEIENKEMLDIRTY